MEIWHATYVVLQRRFESRPISDALFLFGPAEGALVVPFHVRCSLALALPVARRQRVAVGTFDSPPPNLLTCRVTGFMKRCAPRAPNTPLPSPGTPIACSSVPCTYVAPASRAMTRRPLVESSGQWDLGVCPVTAHSCAAQTDVPLCPFDSKRTALERPPNRSAPAPDGFAGKLALPIQAQLGRRGHGGLWGAGLKELLALPSLDRRRRCARRGRGAAAIAARGRRGTEAQVGLALWAGVRYGARRTRRVQRRVRATMMPCAMACPAAHQRAVPRCRWIDAPLGLSTARSARSGPRLCCASPQPGQQLHMCACWLLARMRARAGGV